MIYRKMIVHGIDGVQTVVADCADMVLLIAKGEEPDYTVAGLPAYRDQARRAAEIRREHPWACVERGR